MNSRERLLTTMSLKKADRVPISTYEMVGLDKDSFYSNSPSYAKLYKLINEKTDCLYMSDLDSDQKFNHSAYDVEYSDESFFEDGYNVNIRTYNTPLKKLKSITKRNNKVITTWHIEHLCKSLEDVDAVMSIPYVPVNYNTSTLNRIHENLGNMGIAMGGLGDGAFQAMDLMEFGESMVWAMSEKEHFKKTAFKLHDRIMQNLEKQLSTHTFDIYRICGSEYLTPPYLPPYIFEEMEYPMLKDMIDLLHKNNSLARVHTHGNIAKVIDMIVDAGADAIDPCEPPPDGDIELKELKKRYGDKVCIFGNIELKLLEHGTVQEVKDAVKKCIDDAAYDGGYVIMPTAAPIDAVLSPKTEENYFAFIETAYEYGKY